MRHGHGPTAFVQEVDKLVDEALLIADEVLTGRAAPAIGLPLTALGFNPI